MQVRLGVLHCELERQSKALSRETDLRQKERALLQRKGKRGGVGGWVTPPGHHGAPTRSPRGRPVSLPPVFAERAAR